MPLSASVKKRFLIHIVSIPTLKQGTVVTYLGKK